MNSWIREIPATEPEVRALVMEYFHRHKPEEVRLHMWTGQLIIGAVIRPSMGGPVWREFWLTLEHLQRNL